MSFVDYSGIKELNSHSAIINGELHHDIPDYMVYVESENDLANLTDIPVGGIAALYGFSNAWQKSSDGTWVSMMPTNE